MSNRRSFYDRATPEEREKIRSAALHMRCDYCGAIPGHPCLGKAGKPSKPHAIRQPIEKASAAPVKPPEDLTLPITPRQFIAFLNRIPECWKDAQLTIQDSVHGIVTAKRIAINEEANGKRVIILGTQPLSVNSY